MDCAQETRELEVLESRSLPWGRFSAQRPVTEGATIGTVSLALSHRVMKFCNWKAPAKNTKPSP